MRPAGGSAWFRFRCERGGLGRQVFTQYNLSPLARAGITTIHDVSFFVGPEWFSSRDRVLLQKFVPSSARRAEAVITVSETSRQDILRFIPDIGDKLYVSLLAASPEFRPFDRQHSLETLQRLGVSEPFMLTAGTRWARKNIELAIEACERLPDSISHRLVAAGHAEPARSNRTIQLGWVEHADLVTLFGRAALYLCPSRYEGFGLPIVEAFAAGAPVIASAGGALREIAGGAAVIVESFDPSAWMEAIRTVLTDSSNLSAMRERGFRRAQDFSWKQTALRTLEAYRRAAK
jgi:alpha-1,3-rhamnosyl/mannosyltransferase